MTGRLIVAIISTCLEESAIAFGVLWGLPRLGANLPLWLSILILIPLMCVWLFYSVFTYHKGTIALQQAQLLGMPNMIGTKGVVISPLDPVGLVRINIENWVASSPEGELEIGDEVVVTGQERLRLTVKKLDEGS